MKAVSDVIAPLSGEIVEVNSALGDTPEAINDDPYAEGWMVKIRLSNRARWTADGRAAYEHLTNEPLHLRHRRRPPGDARGIGVELVDDLFADIPEAVRLGRALDLPAGKPEQEVYAQLRDLAARNVSPEDELSFLGAGMYDHYVPALIDSILSRSEFLTPYTPYQPEVSQGGLQVMFEYQTAISELTGLPVSNASRLRGPERARRRRLPGEAAQRPHALRRLAGVHPHSRETLATTAPAGARRSRRSRWSTGSPTRRAAGAIDDDAAAVLLQPNFLGAVEDLEALAAPRTRPAR